MALRAPRGDQLVAERPREREIGEAVAVEVAELAAAEPELDPAETVRLDAHAVPRRDLGPDALCGRHTCSNARYPPFMPFYQRLGEVPRKRHIPPRENGTLLNEEVLCFEGCRGNEESHYRHASRV